MVLNPNKLNTKFGHVPTQDLFNITDPSNTVTPASECPTSPRVFSVTRWLDHPIGDRYEEC